MSLADCAEHQQLLSAAGAVPAAAALLARGAPAVQETLGLGSGLGSGLGLAHPNPNPNPNQGWALG